MSNVRAMFRRRREPDAKTREFLAWMDRMAAVTERRDVDRLAELRTVRGLLDGRCVYGRSVRLVFDESTNVELWRSMLDEGIAHLEARIPQIDTRNHALQEGA